MKKRLLAVILTMCILITTPAIAMAAETEITLTANVDGETVKTVEVNGVSYLFLPPTADLTKLTLRFESDDFNTDAITVKGGLGSVQFAEDINVKAISKQDSDYRYALSAATDDGGYYNFYIMQGSNIPTLYINSSDDEKGREWVDQSKKNKALGDMKMLAHDGKAIYDGELTEIKARGNSTFTYYDKKAYQIKLKDKTDLVGTGEKVKTWVLLANYTDATMMHDKLFKDLAAELGMAYVVSCDWVNLYYDGEYRGVYLLTEKNSVNSTSVDITDMEEAYTAVNANYGDNMKVVEDTNKYGQKYLYTDGLTEPEEITGGYLIERNLNFVDDENGFYTKQGAAFNIKSPEYIGKEAMTYINEYYQDFEDAVFATDEKGNYTGYNEATGKYYYEYVDKTSLIKTFLMQELALNPDGFYSSLYFYKDSGDIMYAGPIWDQDLTLGTGWSKYIGTHIVDYHYLEAGLIKIPDFRQSLEEYYTTVFAPEIEELIEKDGKIDEYNSALKMNAEMNYRLWPYVRMGDPSLEGHIWKDASYEIVVADMKKWINERMAVLDDIYKTDVMTRGTFIAMLAHTNGCDISPQNGEDWKQPAIRWAVENSISDGLRMDEPVTREEIATMIYRCEDKPAGADSLNRFTDGSDVSYWAKDAMQWAVSEGIYNGNTDGSLKPRRIATADEAVQVIGNYVSVHK